MFYSYYRFKDTQVNLTSVNDFLTAPSGTLFEKFTGEVFIKTDLGVFDKIQRYVLSRDEQDQRYGTLDFGNIWSQQNDFNGPLNSTGTNVFTGANTFNSGVLTIGSNITSSGLNTFSGVTSFTGAVNLDGTTNYGGNVLFNGTVGFTSTLTLGTSANIISSAVNTWNSTNNFNSSCAFSANTYAGHQTPLTTDIYDLGSSTKLWRSLHVSGLINAGTLSATDYFVNSNISNNSYIQFRDFGNSAWRNLGYGADGLWKIEDITGQHELAHDGNLRTKTEAILVSLTAPINTTSSLDVGGSTNFTGTVGLSASAGITSDGNNIWNGSNDFNLNINLSASAPITSLGNNTWSGTNSFNALTINAGNALTVDGTSTFNDISDFTASASFVSNTYAGNQTPTVTGTYDLGSATNEWRNIYATGAIESGSILTDSINVGRVGQLSSWVGLWDATENLHKRIGYSGDKWQVEDTTTPGVFHDVVHTGNASTVSVGTASSTASLDTTLNAASTAAMQYLTMVQTGASSTPSQVVKTTAALKYMPNTDTLYASIFSGTATSALYADLAEKYISDVQYPIGTVVEIGGSKEITLFKGGSLAGVISEKPGFMLNSESTGQYVALKGKIPVLCSSVIKKGQYCVASNAKAGEVIGVDKVNVGPYMLDIVGIALEDSLNGTVMVKV